MADYLAEAKKKLESEYKSGRYDKYAEVMKADVKKALIDFCEQDAEFAQAVVQGGSFSDCMKAVAKNCGKSISDLEAFRRAVRFYFPGAEIRVKMSIDLIGDAAKPDEAAQDSFGIILDLADFL